VTARTETPALWTAHDRMMLAAALGGGEVMLDSREAGRIIATVDALREALRDCVKAVNEEVCASGESKRNASPTIRAHWNTAEKAEALLAALEGKP
jgi:hypothetical protein